MSSGLGFIGPGMVTGAGLCFDGGDVGPCVVEGGASGTAVLCPENQCTVLGYTGPEVAITDGWSGGASSASLAADRACIAGETAAWGGPTWGSMLTFNLGPAVDSTGDAGVPGLPTAIAAPVQVGGLGIDVQFSFASGETPTAQQLLLVVFVADPDAGTWYADEYCAELPATNALVYVPWSALTYQCWDAGNPALAGPPRTGVVGVQVSAVYGSTVADTYNLCVDQLSIAP